MPVVNYATVNGRILHEDRNGVKTLFMPDTLGNVIETRNMDTGAQTSSTTYWPYGEVRTQTGTNPSPFGFCGVWGYYTQAGQPTYVRARYYRPNLGRWQTVDPLWPWQKAYGYVNNRAASQIDYSGQYSAGPNQGGRIPRQSRRGNPRTWTYGNYCGEDNWKRGCDRPEPISCVDFACREHDDCLDKSNDAYWTGKGARCNCDLLRNAIWCYKFGRCSFRRYTADCQAAEDIIFAFSAICSLGWPVVPGPELGLPPVYVPRPGDAPGGPPPGANVGTRWSPIYV